MDKKQKISMTILGSVVGFVNGFFGGGGGMLVVPMLTLVNKFSQKQSHATAILVILPITIISVIAYVIGDGLGVDFSTIAYTTLGVAMGGGVGAFALKKINNKALVKIFAVVMFIAGAKMLFF